MCMQVGITWRIIKARRVRGDKGGSEIFGQIIYFSFCFILPGVFKHHLKLLFSFCLCVSVFFEIKLPLGFVYYVMYSYSEFRFFSNISTPIRVCAYYALTCSECLKETKTQFKNKPSQLNTAFFFISIFQLFRSTFPE